MYKKEKEIHNPALLEEILSENIVCRIALVDGDNPYILPMNYGYTENTIFLHTAPLGRKLDIIAKNNKVCFEVTDSIDIILGERGCDCGTKFRSVVGFGRIYPVSEPQDKIDALKILMHQHTKKTEWDFDPKIVEKTMILKIEIESLTGKMSGM